MATWLELRCERMLPGDWRGGCWSHANNGPHALVHDATLDILAALRDMHAEGRRQGWVRTRDGWVCPYCAAQPK